MKTFHIYFTYEKLIYIFFLYFEPTFTVGDPVILGYLIISRKIWDLVMSSQAEQ
jgi:hypothetical protein